MIKVTLLQNTMVNRERHVAGEIVELEDAVAKKYCDAELAVPVYAEDLEKVDMSIDEEAVVDETEAEVEIEETAAALEAVEQAEETEVVEGEEVVEETAEPKQEVAENKGNKKGKK